MPHSDERLTAARSAIAAAVLDALPPARLGGIELWPAQRRIVARARRAVRQHGGCLIAEDVGRGKTFIALALAREWTRPAVIAPASLRDTWRRAMDRAGVPCAFASHESLSRTRDASFDADVIIVDESHHYRNAATRRYDAMVALCARAAVVLLTATPLQNRRRDLAAQLALYLGEAAFELDDASLAALVIRGAGPDDAHLPVARQPEWVHTGADDTRVLSAILALRTPPGPLDAGDGGALRTIGLVRAWSSSRAALDATLRARMRIATAVEQGIAAGRMPTRSELRAWSAGDDAVQLGFAELLMHATGGEGAPGEISRAIAMELEGIARLRTLLRTGSDPDIARVAALRDLRQRHAGERLLVFSERAATIAAVYALLRGEPGVGMLTANAARIASGSLPRAELLARFAPRAQGARAYPGHHAVTLLLTTDLLSEGMNLQDASVVVHLDLPWNPARLQQRLGRVRRPGGHAEVASYLLAPPARSAALVDAEAMLRRKLRDAERVLGRAGSVLPPLLVLSPPPSGEGAASAFGAVVGALEEWQGHAGDSAGIIACARSAQDGWLAALDDGRLLCFHEGSVSEDPLALWRACESACGDDAGLLAQPIASARETLATWLANERVDRLSGIRGTLPPMRRTVERWLHRCITSAPRHQHASCAADASRIRQALGRPLPLGIERQLARCTSDADLRRALPQCAAIVASRHPVLHQDQRSPRMAALIVFVTDAASNVTGPATRR